MDRFEKYYPVLIVSDYRCELIQHHTINQYLSHVSYPNILTARQAIIIDTFSIVIIDLSIPLQSKLTLVKEACFYQPFAMIITIGKTKVLETTGILSSFPLIFAIDSIELLANKLNAFVNNGFLFQKEMLKANYFQLQKLH